ncbi:thiamine phosphate synthase [Lactobacillus xylocopicola]|uniref:Thiamine-phosphate synthase n=1 Tax=Lactobacillus xylocopicola TaxID=2976676 RepID=A0ABN6SPD5_9LACO|nr:thiamine phosphate synthase [Lactobacillus xylocopicola]BDR61152.1 thiamine-phosphate synthase [Lactobacillus xylocopicola]
MQKFNSQLLRAYFICGSQDVPAGKTLPGLVEEALKAGITAYQFRDKGPRSTLAAAARLPLARQLHGLCQQYHVPFFVDDDVDLAQAIGAEGIHVGQSDEAIKQVVAAVHEQMMVGYSCSTLAEIIQGDHIGGIDYYGSGPIFATQSKDDADPEIGLSGLTQLVEQTNRPIVAIGGITVESLPAIAQTGAAGASVISMIASSTNIKQTVQAMLAAPWNN